MLIGVVSDTHGHEDYTREAVRMLETFGVLRIIHCGDIGSPRIPPLFAQWPTDWVFGNVDGRPAELQASIEAIEHHTCHGRFGSIDCGERRIAVLHGDDSRRLRETINGGQYDLVCSGHTHQSETRQEGSTLVLNPGALYRANPHTFAVVELDNLEATIVSVGSHTR